jgi:hypothetical protein
VARKTATPKKPLNDDDDFDLIAEALKADILDASSRSKEPLARRRAAQAKLSKLLEVDEAREREVRDKEHGACVAAARERADRLTAQQLQLIAKRAPLMQQIQALLSRLEA